ncbi:hypothetical protein [Bacillus sp. Brlt_9]|uniref:hypothetical protein n=1 Tax=Bacillus sp. Brlt_9 TaxID=3110916 RepID=UPI003F7CAC28
MKLQIINEYFGFRGTNPAVMLGTGQNSKTLEFNFECDEIQADEIEREITVNLVELIRTLNVVKELGTNGSVGILNDSYSTYTNVTSELNIRYVESDDVFILEINNGFEFHFDAYKLLAILEALNY